MDPVYVPPNPVFGQGRIVNLGADDAVEGIDFKLTRGGVIRGRVMDAGGLPVIEERISLTQVDEKGAAVPAANPVWANYMMYTTDDRGVYRLYGLSPGRYKVNSGASITEPLSDRIALAVVDGCKKAFNMAHVQAAIPDFSIICILQGWSDSG